ncbi:hypothetical protein ACFPRL_15795 [Pseudoclavibacter helvolus]
MVPWHLRTWAQVPSSCSRKTARSGRRRASSSRTAAQHHPTAPRSRLEMACTLRDGLQPIHVRLTHLESEERGASVFVRVLGGYQMVTRASGASQRASFSVTSNAS